MREKPPHVAAAGVYKAFDKIKLPCNTKALWKGTPCYTVATDKPTANTLFKWSNTKGFSPKVGTKAWKSESITVSQ